MATRKREDEELVCPAEPEAEENASALRRQPILVSIMFESFRSQCVIRALRARNYSLSAATFRASDILGWIVNNSKIITGYGGPLWQLNEVLTVENSHSTITLTTGF
jgi:hypothetical protein